MLGLAFLAFFFLFPGFRAHKERTFILIKPDGVQRGLIGKIISRFENKGLKLVALKTIKAGKNVLLEHYSELSDKPFFNGLIEYMQLGPMIAMVWEGPNVVQMSRDMIGSTNPLDASPGTIRGDFCLSVGRNAIHGSDSIESAKREIKLWFSKDELVDWEPALESWISAEN